MARIYLDHNATCPLRPEAAEALAGAGAAANASSTHLEGRKARALLEEARAKVAAFLGAPEGEIVFTSGGTEAIVAAVRGACDDAPPARRTLVVSAVEHSAVLHAAAACAARGFRVERIPVDRHGRVDPERFASRVGEGTALAALQAANPETGVLQPVEAVDSACRKAGVPLLVDAVQFVGKEEIPEGGFAGDLLAVSAHKIGGPQGIGALRIRGNALHTALIPGLQERRRRGGTEPVALAVAFAAAASVPPEAGRLRELREVLEAGLGEAPVGATIHGRGAPRLPNTVLFSVPGVRGESLAIAADLDGFAISTGSACASGAVEPSHVLRAMGLSEEDSRGAVRVSLGWTNGGGDVGEFRRALPGWIERARGPGPP